MLKMSKTRKEVEKNRFWSAKHFINQGKSLLDWLESSRIPFKLGRSCMYIGFPSNTLKVYPHHNGRSNKTVTITKDGKELCTFNCDVDSKVVIEKIQDFLGEDNEKVGYD